MKKCDILSKLFIINLNRQIYKVSINIDLNRTFVKNKGAI